MLLKKHFAPVPPEGYFDNFWPSVDQRIDSDDAAGGGNGEAEEVVFKSSPALKMLNIPERKAPEPEEPPVKVEQSSTPQAPPAPSSSFRWPVAFVLAAAIITGGFLYHKKMNPPQPRTTADVDPHGTIGAGLAHQEADRKTVEQEPAGEKADATMLASATGIDASTASPEPPRTVEERKRMPRRRPARRSVRRARPRKPEKAEAPPPPPAPKPAAQPKRRKGTELDSLIDNAIGARPAAPKKAPAKTEPAVDSSLPEQLTMNDIRAGMRKINSRVQACYDKFQIEGKATVNLTITKAGGVKSVLIKGKFFGTDTGECVAKAVKRARFPKFRGKDMTINYPFILQ